MPGSPHHPRTQPFPPARAGKDGEHNITQLCNPRGEPLRVALAHDWLCGLRGGEHVLEDCIAALTGAGACITGLYVMFDDGRSLAPGIDQQQTYSSGLGKLPGASTHLRKHLLPLYPLAVHQLSRLIAAHQPRHRADLLLSTSSSAVKGISVRGLHIPHISYIHSPARYLWGRGDEYAMGKGGWLRSLGLNLFGPWLRRWDRRTAANADHLLANSTHTSQLITSAWGRDADVMFPGVPTEHFSPPSGTVPAQRDGSWLIVSALEPYKRIDLALGAADRAGARLTIVGDGSQRSALEALARHGLVHHLQPAGSPALYEATTRPHRHVVCRGCGEVVDVELTGGEPSAIRPRPGHGYDIDAVEITFWGLCPRCRRTADETNETNETHDEEHTPWTT